MQRVRPAGARTEGARPAGERAAVVARPAVEQTRQRVPARSQEPERSQLATPDRWKWGPQWTAPISIRTRFWIAPKRWSPILASTTISKAGLPRRAGPSVGSRSTREVATLQVRFAWRTGASQAVLTQGSST